MSRAIVVAVALATMVAACSRPGTPAPGGESARGAGGASAPRDSAGAAPAGEIACTAIGCVSGLRMRIEGVTGVMERVEAWPLGETRVTYTVRCTELLPCTGEVFFPDWTPDRVAVRVVMRDGATFAQEEAMPQYERSQPNGPQCDPICMNGRVTVRPAPAGRGR